MITPSLKIFICLGLLGLVWAQIDQPEDLYQQIFGFSTAKSPLPVLEPGETLKLLKHLQDFYKSRDDKISQERKIQIDELVAESGFDSNSCKRTSLANWGHLAKIYENSGNLSPYLEYIRHEHFAFCQREFDSSLHGSLSRLTEEQIAQIKQFRALVQAKNCRPIDDPYTVINTGPVAEAVLAFMQINNHFSLHGLAQEFKDKKTGKSSFSREIENVIGDLCRAISREFDTKIEISSFYTRYADLVDKMNEDTKNWITNARICRVYSDNMSDVVTKAFDLYKSGSKSKSLSNLLTGCFHSKATDM